MIRFSPKQVFMPHDKSTSVVGALREAPTLRISYDKAGHRPTPTQESTLSPFFDHYKTGRYLIFGLICVSAISIALMTLSLPVHAQNTPVPPLLRYGDHVESEIGGDRSSQTWQFTGRADDVVVIDMLVLPNSELDPVLQLVSPEGRLLLEDDDSGDTTNARLGPMRLPLTGGYQVVASGYAGHGNFVLALTSLESMVPLALNKPLELTLDGDHPLTYLRLDNPADDILRLSTSATRLSDTPIMTIYDQSGGLVSGTSYTLGGVVDPFVSHADTIYIIAVSLPYPIPGENHTYRVELVPSQIELLQSGAQIEGEISLDAATVHYFAAQAGQRVKLHIERLSSQTSPALYVRSLDGQYFLFSSTAETLTDLTVTLDIPADALYSIEISDGAYSGERGRFRLSFELN